MLRKLTRLVDGSAVPIEWPHLFQREKTTGPERIAIAPREDPTGLLGELAGAIGPECFLLYVLVACRDQECGRYESPFVPLAEVRGFLEEYRELLTNDARQELWIGSSDERGLLVLDDHGIIYAYGPLEEFERRLEQRGLESGAFEIPAPHGHHFHGEYDAMVERLLTRWEWRRTSLQPSDAR